MDDRRPGWAWPLWVAVGAVFILVVLGDAGASDGVGAGLQVALSTIVAALAWRASRCLTGRLRLAWGFVAAAAAAVVLALAGLVGWLAVGGDVPQDPDLWWLLGLVNGLSFVGLLFLSPPEIRGDSATRFALDGLIVGTAILFILLAGVEQWQPGNPGVDLTAVIYPAIDAAALTVVLLVITRRSGHVPAWYMFVSTSFVLVLATDTIAAAWPDGPTATVFADGGYYIQLGLVASAALLAGPWPPTTQSPERLAAQWAVYVPFGVAILAAMYDYVENSGLVAPLFYMAVLAVVLVLTRTILVLGENARLAYSLRESAEFKTQLLRFISHEVANPLSPLRLQLHMLVEGRAKDVPRAWETMDRSIRRLESLSRDVRMMALAETRRLVKDPKPTDLAPRVQAAVTAHQVLAEQHGLVLQADLEPATVPVDAERFDQVVDNLLSNALKFTPTGGRVTVRLRPDEEGAVLEVSDTGAGLSQEQREKLFTAFGRQHGDSEPGLGLGLYLCKSIVDGHGGRITAASDGADRGATFRVTLPAAPRTSDPELPPRPRYEPLATPDPPAP